MNVKFDRLSDVTAEVTVTLEEKDYAADVKKLLKEISKNRPEPGFRPGHTPEALLRKKYGKSAKMETLERKVSDALYEYIKENNLHVLGSPVPVANEGFNIDATDFDFKFTIGLAPDIDTHLGKELTIPYYNIKVSDEMIDRQSEALRRRMGNQVPGDKTEPNCLVKGVLTELDADGKPLEGGIVVENGILAPQYFKSEEQQKLFDDRKPGDTVVFNPWATADGNPAELSSMLNIDKEQVEAHKGDFSIVIKEIIVLRPAELNQEFYDQAFGADKVHNEEEYRAALKDMIARQLQADSNYRFTLDAKDVIMKAVGDVDLPDEILKDFLKRENEALNDENIEAEYAKSRPQLVWQLVRDEMLRKLDIKVDENDLLSVAAQAAAQQFAQYGMTNVPSDTLERYAKEILRDNRSREQVVGQAVDNKLYNGIRASVTLDEKEVSVEEFNNLFKEMMEAQAAE